MPQKNRSKNQNEKRVPAWVWIFTGAVLGAFVMFLFRLSELPEVPQAASKTPQASNKTEPSKPKLPEFGFYDLLPDAKITVPDTPKPKGNSATASKEDNVEYILQVASFKSKDDAERVRAELILINLDARVESAKVRTGETWYRVLVGPFPSRSLLAKARSTLFANKHEALVLKRPKEG